MKRDELEKALAKPIAESAETLSMDDFDPWSDIVVNIHGSYSSEMDRLMIGALEAARDQTTFEFMDAWGVTGELALYILSGNGLTEYGTSPRGGWPGFEIADLWQTLIDKWRAYADVMWGDDWERAEPPPVNSGDKTR